MEPIRLPSFCSRAARNRGPSPPSHRCEVIGAGFNHVEQLRLQDLGMEKGRTPVTKKNISLVAHRLRQMAGSGGKGLLNSQPDEVTLE